MTIWYVDQQNGSDDNDGKTKETPFKTWMAADKVLKSYDIVRIRGVYASEVPIIIKAFGLQVTGWD